MKKIVIVLFLVSFLICYGCKKNEQTENTGLLKGTITMSGAWALYPMAVGWQMFYQMLLILEMFQEK